MRNRLIPFFASLTVATAAYFAATACGYDPIGEEVRYSLFDSKTSQNPSLAPFYFTTNFAYNIDNSAGLARGKQQNIAEWAAYAKLPTTTGIAEVVYDWDIATTKIWLGNFKKGAAVGNNNAFAAKLAETNNLAAATYLHFAKTCEQSSQKYSDDWSEAAKPLPTDKYDAVISQARTSFQKENDPFLKQRYGYQLVMLLRYKTDWAACVKAFDDCVAPYGDKTVVYWWALAHKATATYFTGEKEKADYYFAQVFAHDDAKKARMNQGYEATNIKKSLEFCKNNDEKAALYTLDAIHSPGRTIENLQKVLDYTPANPDLDVLLVREVNKVEDWVLTPRITGSSPANDVEIRDDVPQVSDATLDYKILEIANLKSDEAYTAKVFTWVKTTASSPKLHNPALWHTAAAHLALILGNYEEAKTALALAEKAKGKTPAIDKQIHLTGIMARLNFDITGEMSHDELYKDLVWMRKQRDESKQGNDDGYNQNTDYNRWIAALATRADEQKNIPLAALFYAESQNYVSKGWDSGTNNDGFIYYLDRNGTSDHVEAVISMITAQQKDNLIKLLTDSLAKRVNRLTDVLGTKYLREDKLEKAVAAYESIPKEWFKEKKCGYQIYDKYLHEDPFWVGVQDEKKLRYSRKGYVLRLMGLKEEVKDPTKNQAWAQYQVANAYYNISYHGNAWARSRYWWSVYPSIHNGIAHEDQEDRDYYTAKRAKTAYQAAAELAKDKAFKALCLRMVATCQLHELSYNDIVRAYNYDEDKKGFQLDKTLAAVDLKKNYAEFYKKLMGDCTGWAAFLQKGK